MADQEDDAMCTKDNYVSPYLLRPRRSYAEVMRNTSANIARATGREGSVASNRADDEGVASRIPKRDPRLEGEARLQPRGHLP